jgi:hypothetical protein
MTTHQRRFLAEMRVSGSHLQARGGAAHARFALQPVDRATPWTQMATAKKCVELPCPMGEFAALRQANISWLPVCPPNRLAAPS